MLRRIFFICGIVSVLVYVAAVVVGGIVTSGYNHLSMAVSELIAAGAAQKPLLDIFFIVYNVLLAVFAWTVGMSVRGERRIGLAGAAVLGGVAIVGLVMTLFFPMDPRGAHATATGTVHLVLAGVLSLGSILAIVFLALGMSARDAFWMYSMISAIVVLVSGGFAAATAARGAPLMGLAERITIGLFLQWILVYALRFVREDIGR